MGRPLLSTENLCKGTVRRSSLPVVMISRRCTKNYESVALLERTNALNNFMVIFSAFVPVAYEAEADVKY